MEVQQRASDVQLRQTAFAVAYRMLGSVADAEDVVQEALLRVHQAYGRGEQLLEPAAYVTTVASRLSLDVLRSARLRREVYVGEWLPEPLVTDPAQDPAERAELADSLSMAFLVMLERLSPEQRAALLLHDVFGYGYEEVAGVLGTSTDNARQLTSRARRHVHTGRPRPVTAGQQRQLAERFYAAVGSGDLAGLEALLAADVVLRGDGGGKVPALAQPVMGRAHVARTLLAWMRAGQDRQVRLHPAMVNGAPGAVARDQAGRVLSVLALDIQDCGIAGLCSVVNPDKLAHLGPVGDLWSPG